MKTKLYSFDQITELFKASTDLLKELDNAFDTIGDDIIPISLRAAYGKMNQVIQEIKLTK